MRRFTHSRLVAVAVLVPFLFAIFGISAHAATTPTITWTTPSAIYYGSALSAAQLNAKASVPGAFAYTPAAGTILQAGTQSLSVTFTPTDTTTYTSATASVSLLVKPVATHLIWQAPGPIVYGTPLSASQLRATSNVPGTFTYTPALGSVLTGGAHTLSVSFQPTDANDYTPSTASVTLNVQRAYPHITWPVPLGIAYGTPLSATQLNATAPIPGAFTYTPGLGAILSTGTNRITMTFQPTDSTDYSPASGFVNIIVNRAVPHITWPTPATIVYGTPLNGSQLNATTTVPGYFTYTPAFGTVLETGAEKLSASFHPADTTNFTSPTVTVWFNVKQAVPQITWATPQAVPVGSSLTATQLNAVAYAPGTKTPIDGTYLFTPGLGTKLTSTGTETLKVAFTPADRSDYAWAQTSVTLNVVIAGIIAWGDSLTEGYQGITNRGTYPSDLAKLIVLPIVNQGINGESSTQIGVRQGAIPSYATVSGGQIPASGTVPVAFKTNYEPVGVAGSLVGVHGSIGLSGSTYSFKRDAAGNEVDAPGTPQYIVDKPYANYLPIFWEGRNNFRLNIVASILPDIAAQVATVPPGVDYLVLSLTNNNWQTDWLGASEYNQIVSINNTLATTYKSHYVDVRTPLVAAYDPTSIVDLSDNAHDEVPTSLRAVVGNGTLTSDIGPADTTFQVNVTPGSLQNLFILTIDTGTNAENVAIVSFTGNTVTVTRNFGGNNTSHAASTAITVTDKTHLNAKGYQIVANTVAAALPQYAK